MRCERCDGFLALEREERGNDIRVCINCGRSPDKVKPLVMPYDEQLKAAREVGDTEIPKRRRRRLYKEGWE